MKHQAKAYFEISKKEWNAMVVLLVLMFLILAIPFTLPLFQKPQVMDTRAFNIAVTALDKAVGNNHFIEGNDPVLDKKLSNPIMFNFNPNGLTVKNWLRLGLSLRQIKLIKNYEAKGGKFYTKTDVEKMYSISAGEYACLAPYINLPEETSTGAKTDHTVQINTADSTTLVKLKGIGPAFASRIIAYRKQLGGFYNKAQLMEVYGINSLKFRIIEPQIMVDIARIKKIKINSATIDDLRPLPYLNFKQMNAIVQYRNEHGGFRSINDLRPIVLLDNKILSKIEPYLSYQ